MDSGQLQAFDLVVRHGSFSKAARALDLSQPAISLRIQALEAEVGGPLFRRGAHRAALTELGASFLPYARQALAALARGVEVARAAESGQRGRVRLGALPSLAGGFLARTVGALQREAPHLDLEIHTGHTPQLLEMLHDGFVQVALVYGPSYSAEVTELARFREELVLVAARGHPATRGPLDLAALPAVADPLWRVDWTPEANQWQARVLPADTPRREVPIHMAHELVRGGQGAALLSRELVALDLAEGRLMTVQAPVPPLARMSALVHLRRDAPLPPAVATFARLLREHAHRLLAS